MCFYNAPKSTKGRRLANNLHRTFDRKYDKHQPNRGFRGTVSERNLYVLRNTTPVAVFWNWEISGTSVTNNGWF